MLKNIGVRLKELRKKKGLTQTELARKLGTTAGYISQIESGQSIPGGEILYLVKQHFLDVSLDWLLTGIDAEGVEVYNGEETEFCKKLLRIMRTKQEKTVTAIKQNLDAFLDNPDREKTAVPKKAASNEK